MGDVKRYKTIGGISCFRPPDMICPELLPYFPENLNFWSTSCLAKTICKDGVCQEKGCFMGNWVRQQYGFESITPEFKLEWEQWTESFIAISTSHPQIKAKAKRPEMAFAAAKKAFKHWNQGEPREGTIMAGEMAILAGVNTPVLLTHIRKHNMPVPKNELGYYLFDPWWVKILIEYFKKEPRGHE